MIPTWRELAYRAWLLWRHSDARKLWRRKVTTRRLRRRGGCLASSIEKIGAGLVAATPGIGGALGSATAAAIAAGYRRDGTPIEVRYPDYNNLPLGVSGLMGAGLHGVVMQREAMEKKQRQLRVEADVAAYAVSRQKYLDFPRPPILLGPFPPARED